MKKQKKSNASFDPNGNYTGKFYVEKSGTPEVEDTPPEQDADDL